MRRTGGARSNQSPDVVDGRPRSRRWSSAIGWLLLAAVLVIGAWAGLASLGLSPAPTASPAPVTYTVQTGVVERFMSFTAEAQWPSVPIGSAADGGVVTTVGLDSPATVNVGDMLYTVNLRPTFAAEGSVPAFRDLGQGAKGADVAQMQQFLASLGFRDHGVTGDFDQQTRRSVLAWQRAVGLEPDGVVRRSDLLFLGSLPRVVKATPYLTVGAQLTPGAPVLEALADAPEFSIRLAREQADLVPLKGAVVVHHDHGSWAGTISAAETTAEGELRLTIEAPDRGSLCGGECETVAVDSRALFGADVIVVPRTVGPLVPVAALFTGPDGEVTVRLADGTERRVEVIAVADGRAVVAGLEPGSTILLFAAPSQPDSQVPRSSPS